MKERPATPEQETAGCAAVSLSITTTLRITRYDPDGKAVEQGESTWTTRYLFRYEAVHLLHRCGFQVETLVGDYRYGPVTEKGQLIFEAKLGDRSAACAGNHSVGSPPSIPNPRTCREGTKVIPKLQYYDWGNQARGAVQGKPQREGTQRCLTSDTACDIMFFVLITAYIKTRLSRPNALAAYLPARCG